MEQVREDLWQATLEQKEGINSCDFLLLRPEGNVLFYQAPKEGEFEATPGHTEGGVSCVYRSPHGEVYLFSGDTMIPVKGQWIAQTVPEHGGHAATLKRSLLRLCDLEPDLVLSSASVGEQTVVEVGRDPWIRAVEETAGRPPIGAV